MKYYRKVKKEERKKERKKERQKERRLNVGIVPQEIL